MVAVGQGSVAGEGERSAGEYHMETGQARERDPTTSDTEYTRGEWAGRISGWSLETTGCVSLEVQ